MRNENCILTDFLPYINITSVFIIIIRSSLVHRDPNLKLIETSNSSYKLIHYNSYFFPLSVHLET